MCAKLRNVNTSIRKGVIMEKATELNLDTIAEEAKILEDAEQNEMELAYEAMCRFLEPADWTVVK